MMEDWPEYTSHKTVRVATIFQIVEHGGTLSILVKPYGDDRIERFVPTEEAMIVRAQVGGYAVVYEDGYKSISPKKAFEEGYKPAPTELRRAIAHAINCVSAENGSDTPDFILAEFLTDCLAAFDKASRWREQWHGGMPARAWDGTNAGPGAIVTRAGNPSTS